MYCKDNAGLVHLVTPVNEEFTMCGNAWDGDAEGMYGDSSDDPYAWERVPRGPVTCPKCAAIVIVAKRARLSRKVVEKASRTE